MVNLVGLGTDNVTCRENILFEIDAYMTRTAFHYAQNVIIVSVYVINRPIREKGDTSLQIFQNQIVEQLYV